MRKNPSFRSSGKTKETFRLRACHLDGGIADLEFCASP